MSSIRKLMKKLHVPASPQLDETICDEISKASATQVYRHSQVLWRITRRALPFAACVLLGFGVGAWLFQGATVVRRPAETGQVVRESEARRETPAEVDTSEFWSYRRLYERGIRTTRKRSVRLIWDSPILKPKLGDAI